MRKILIVDDEVNIGLLLSKFLVRNSFSVSTATSGVAAMDYLAKEQSQYRCSYNNWLFRYKTSGGVD
jgi:DNA-binding response OmpR family regulator